MQYWLLKSEPDVYGWDRLLADGETVWDGVRNYTARNNLRAMQVGDEAFYYHSNIGREIVGICRISRAAYADPTDDSGKWSAVSVQPVRAFKRPVTLAEIKADPALAQFQLVRQSRLSVVPVRPQEWRQVLAMETKEA